MSKVEVSSERRKECMEIRIKLACSHFDLNGMTATCPIQFQMELIP